MCPDSMQREQKSFGTLLWGSALSLPLSIISYLYPLSVIAVTVSILLSVSSVSLSSKILNLKVFGEPLCNWCQKYRVALYEDYLF